MMEQGLIFKWKKMYWPKSVGCQQSKQAEAIRLDDLHGVFYLLFAFEGIAFCALFLEIIFHILFTWYTNSTVVPRGHHIK